MYKAEILYKAAVKAALYIYLLPGFSLQVRCCSACRSQIYCSYKKMKTLLIHERAWLKNNKQGINKVVFRNQ